MHWKKLIRENKKQREERHLQNSMCFVVRQCIECTRSHIVCCNMELTATFQVSTFIFWYHTCLQVPAIPLQQYTFSVQFNVILIFHEDLHASESIQTVAFRKWIYKFIYCYFNQRDHSLVHILLIWLSVGLSMYMVVNVF